MKTWLSISLLFGSLSICAQPNPVSFNTAVNTALNGVQAAGSDDNSWMAAMTNSLGPYVKAKVVGNVAGWMNSPYSTADWISYPHTCSSNYAEHSCLGNVDEYYKLSINLPANTCAGSVSTPSAYCLSMNFFADNWVHEIFVNGNSAYLNPNTNAYGAYGFIASGGASVTLCNFWQAGQNDLIVHVKSGAPSYPGWTGFLAFVNATLTTAPAFSTSLSQVNVTCFGQSNGSATVSVTGGQGPFSYTWLPIGGNSSSATALTAGIYTVITNNSSCSITNTLQITQPPPFAVTLSTVAPRCPGTPVAVSASGAVSYNWLPGALTGPSVVITPTATAAYTVSGTDGNGCVSSTTFVIAVAKCTSIAEIGTLAADIVPNPASSSLKIGTAEGSTIMVTDASGKLVFSGSCPVEIDVSGWEAGIYIAVISNRNEVIHRRILVTESAN